MLAFACPYRLCGAKPTHWRRGGNDLDRAEALRLHGSLDLLASNSRTLGEIITGIRMAEARRAEVIDGLELETVSERAPGDFLDPGFGRFFWSETSVAFADP